MSVVTRGRVLTPVAVALSATLLATTAAFAADPDPGDDRATAYDGNVTTCAAAGLPGETIQSPGTEDPTNKYVTITDADIPAGDTLLAVVVKGGPAYNVYRGLSTWTMLHSPLDRGGQIPTISHWFACVDRPTTTTTDTTTTTTTTGTTTTGTTTGTTGMTTTTPGGGTATGTSTTTSPVSTTPAAVVPTTGNRTPGARELAFTGLGGGWLVWVGVLLLLAGGIALALPKLARRR